MSIIGSLLGGSIKFFFSYQTPSSETQGLLDKGQATRSTDEENYFV